MHRDRFCLGFRNLLVCCAVVGTWGGIANGSVRRVGGEFLVNAYHYGYQSAGSLVGLADGGYVVLFTGPTTKFPTNYALWARRYDASDAPIGDEFLVNLNYLDATSPIGARFGTNGQFVATWTSFSDQDNSDVFAILFTSTGVPTGSMFQISQSSPYYQQQSDVAGSKNGFVVVWIDNGDPDVSESNVLARRYDVQGAPLGDPFSVPSATSGWPTSPKVSMTTDGGFIVVWMELDIDGSADGVVARRYGVSGEPLGDHFVVNTRTLGPQQYPDVAFLKGGGFVVVWRGDDGDLGGIFGQRVSADGTPAGTEFGVNTSTAGVQQSPSVEPDLDGGFFVSWNGGRVGRPGPGGDGSGSGAFGRHYNATGEPDGDQFQINIQVAGDQGVSNNAVLFTTSDSFVVSWGDRSERDGSGSATIAGRFRLVPGTSPLCGDAARAELVVTVTDALAALRAAVGISECPLCVCDVDGSGTLTAGDALAILKLAIDLPVSTKCPSCASPS